MHAPAFYPRAHREQVTSGLEWEDIACDMDRGFTEKPVYTG